MTAPRIVVRYYGGGHMGMWDRLARVLELSARRHCAGWALDIQDRELAPMSSPLGLQHSVFNTQKLEAWAAVVARAATGDRILLMDADTVILRSLDDVWNLPFDLAYTTKPPESRMPFNAGVLFLRVSPIVKEFIAEWATENRRMLDDPLHLQVWRPAFGGHNQAALGALFTQKRHAGLRVHRLPCVEWNCEDESWASFDPARTRIVHFKGELQRALLSKRRPDDEMRPLIEIWKSIESGSEPEPEPIVPPLPDHREIRPEDQDDQMIRPTDVDAPEPPPLSRRQRRRASRPLTGIGDAQ